MASRQVIAEQLALARRRAEASAGAAAAAVQPMSEYADNRDGFWVDVVGERPHGLQRELNAELDAGCRRLQVQSGTGLGKTVWAGTTAAHWLNTRENSILIYIASTWDQTLNQGFRQIRQCYAESDVPLLGEALTGRVEIGPKWFGTAVSPAKPETLAGYHSDSDTAKLMKALKAEWLAMTDADYWEAIRGKLDERQATGAGGARPAVCCVLDEAAAIPDEIHDAADGIATGPRDVLVRIYNPTKTDGRVFDTWTRQPPTKPSSVCWPGEEEEHAELIAAEEARAAEGRLAAEEQVTPWTVMRWTAFDAPPQLEMESFVDDMRKECGPNYLASPRYQIRVLGLPPLDGGDAYFPWALLEDAAAVDQPQSAGRHMMVDLGFGGGDASVAYLEVNGVMSSVDRWNFEGPALDEQQSANRIIDLAEGWKVAPRNIHVDANTEGAGVVGCLRRLGWWVDGVKGTEKPKGDWTAVLGLPPAGVKTRRQELHWVLRERLRRGMLKIPYTERYRPLWTDLTHLKRKDGDPDAGVVEDKKKFMAREKRSPNESDAVIYGQSRVDPSSVRFRVLKKGRGGRSKVVRRQGRR